jgi:PAS domain S-box-containing protein
VRTREDGIVVAERRVFGERLEGVVADVLVLRDWVRHYGPTDYTSVSVPDGFANALAFFVRHHAAYDQIRLIRPDGMEAVRVERVDGAPVVIPVSELQDKGKRDYFLLGMASNHGVRISKFELNMEHGEIQQPYRPVLRLTARVDAPDGIPAALLVVNYSGASLLGSLKELEDGDRRRLYVVNPDGYWLVGPTTDDQWGFALPERRERTFPGRYPEAWDSMVNKGEPSRLADAGLFTFGVLAPPPDVDCELAERWHLVSHVPRSYLAPPGEQAMVGLGGILLLGVLAYAAQTTRSRLAQASAASALRSSEALFRTVCHSVQDAVIMIDSHGLIVLWSEAAEEMFGFAAEEAVGRDVHALIARGAEKEAADRSMPGFRTHGTGPIVGHLREVTGVRADGSEFPVELSIAAIEFDGRLHAVGTVRDITDRRRAEADLRRLNDELEQRVQERTEELEVANAELVKSRDAAHEANRAKSAFLANMSHEIRTPLNAILGFSRLLQRDPDMGVSQRRDVGTVIRAGEHLLELINGVLEMSKIEAGRAQLNPRSFDLHALLQDMELLFRLRTHAKGLRFGVEFGEDVPRMVWADESRMRQVLINLLGNAVKFTEAGSVSLRAAGKMVEEGARCGRVALTIEVTDTGPGIAASDCERIFAPFEQSAAGMLTEGGTGLGLAISREFARMMGGDIQLESQVGRGSTFRFLAYMETCDALPPNQTHVPGAQVTRLAPDQGPCRVLVVDDQEPNRRLLTRILSGVGISVREADNGETALAEVGRWRPQVVLMDMVMPRMDGYESTRRITELANGQETAVIAVTASAFQEERNKILAAGAVDVIRKPFREDELFAALEHYAGFRFVYGHAPAEGLPNEAANSEDEEIAPERIAALPSSLRSRIHDATLSADPDRLVGLFGEVGAADPGLAPLLNHLLDEFEYDRLLELFP